MVELTGNLLGKAPVCCVGAPFWPIESKAGGMVPDLVAF